MCLRYAFGSYITMSKSKKIKKKNRTLQNTSNMCQLVLALETC